MSTESHETEAPVTITLDIAQFAAHLVPGYSSFDDEGSPEPALGNVLASVTREIVKNIRAEVVEKAISDARNEIAAVVREIVEKTLEEGGVVGDGWTKKTTPPLRELIKQELDTYISKPVGDGYGRGGRETAMQLLVRQEVTKALDADLKSLLEEERERFRAAVRQQAATILASDALGRR